MPSNKKLLQAAGSAGGGNLYPEDVFSTYIYDAAHGTSPIVNGINLADEGGLVWFKHRTAGYSNILFDTERGTSNHLVSNTTAANATSIGLGSFNTDGFSFSGVNLNVNSASHVAWTWRKAAGFCDVVTYTGNGTAGRTVAHSLGSVPKMMIVKNTTTARSWAVYHSSLGGTKDLTLDDTSAAFTRVAVWNDTNPTSSVFTVGSGFLTNTNGDTYVAYLFGDDAVFGEDGDESICKMGSFTPDGSGNADITLGFEPQWLIYKRSDGGNENWQTLDSMRGWASITSGMRELYANASSAEATNNGNQRTSTGFKINGGHSANATYIYMAIRMPMKVPEAGTEVFQALTYSGTGTFPNGTDPNSGVATRTISSSLGFDVDMSLTKWRSGGSGTPAPSSSLMDRFRGIYNELLTYDTAAETQASNTGPRFSTRASRAFDLHDYGVEQLNKSGQALVSYVFKRAPKFMDMVAFSGTGANPLSVSHNLTVPPELMIAKRRNGAVSWMVGVPSVSLGGFLNTTDNLSSTRWNTDWSGFSPTSTIFKVSDGTAGSGDDIIAYLFATLDGISKVGSYTGTGTGTTVNVDCGFSNGARFVFIKRTDATGDWFVYDSSRGIVAGDSPYLFLNTAAQEVNTDYIDPLSSGFSITPDAAVTNTLNVNNATYIFLAIA